MVTDGYYLSFQGDSGDWPSLGACWAKGVLGSVTGKIPFTFGG